MSKPVKGDQIVEVPLPRGGTVTITVNDTDIPGSIGLNEKGEPVWFLLRAQGSNPPTPQLRTILSVIGDDTLRFQPNAMANFLGTISIPVEETERKFEVVHYFLVRERSSLVVPLMR